MPTGQQQETETRLDNYRSIPQFCIKTLLLYQHRICIFGLCVLLVLPLQRTHAVGWVTGGDIQPVKILYQQSQNVLFWRTLGTWPNLE